MRSATTLRRRRSRSLFQNRWCAERTLLHIRQRQSIEGGRLRPSPPATTQPVNGVIVQLDVPVKRRLRPQMRTPRQPMLHRIVMQIIQMVVVVLDIPDQVFPKSALPHPAPMPSVLGIRDGNLPPPPARNARVNASLIRAHRDEKSASPSGNVQTQWICSGINTNASMVNGDSVRTVSNASRSNPRFRSSTNNRRRPYVTTVKKNVPPGANARRYSGITKLYHVGCAPRTIFRSPPRENRKYGTGCAGGKMAVRGAHPTLLWLADMRMVPGN